MLNLLKSIRLIGDDCKINLTAIAVMIAMTRVSFGLDVLSFGFICFALAFYLLGQLHDKGSDRKAQDQFKEITHKLTELETTVGQMGLYKAFKGGSYGN